jgi:hypothetical protein
MYTLKKFMHSCTFPAYKWYRPGSSGNLEPGSELILFCNKWACAFMYAFCVSTCVYVCRYTLLPGTNVDVCMCVCMYTCLRVCAHMYMHVERLHMYPSTYTCTPTWLYILLDVVSRLELPTARVPLYLAHVWNSRWKIAKRSVSEVSFFLLDVFQSFWDSPRRGNISAVGLWVYKTTYDKLSLSSESESESESDFWVWLSLTSESNNRYVYTYKHTNYPECVWFGSSTCFLVCIYMHTYTCMHIHSCIYRYVYTYKHTNYRECVWFRSRNIMLFAEVCRYLYGYVYAYIHITQHYAFCGSMQIHI